MKPGVRAREIARRTGKWMPTGIDDLRGTLDGRTAVFCCAGTSLEASYPEARPIPAAWPIFAVNGGIRLVAPDAAFWVLADLPIVQEYAGYCPPHVQVLAMHEAGPECLRNMMRHEVRTVDSTSDLRDLGDGYRFYSRGTVLIGGLLMARWMGVRRAFVFGLDCYRTREAYYFDRRKPLSRGESHPDRKDSRPHPEAGPGAVITSRLAKMIDRLDAAKAAGLFDGMELWCVGSPHSAQRALPKMDVADFRRVVSPPDGA